jgi:hypothetical protein
MLNLDFVFFRHAVFYKKLSHSLGTGKEHKLKQDKSLLTLKSFSSLGMHAWYVEMLIAICQCAD